MSGERWRQKRGAVSTAHDGSVLRWILHDYPASPELKRWLEIVRERVHFLFPLIQITDSIFGDKAERGRLSRLGLTYFGTPLQTPLDTNRPIVGMDQDADEGPIETCCSSH